jgi:hypothetical protein
VHADNARPHTAKMTWQFMEQNSMQREPRPAYSPDLAAPDFYFFGHAKQLLSGCQFADQDSLLQTATDILRVTRSLNPAESLDNVVSDLVNSAAFVCIALM